MIEKGYIEKIIDKYTYKVRIPRYNKASSSADATSTEALATAEVCIFPGGQPYYFTGDTVWVEFQNDQYTSPVILGKAYSENSLTINSKLYLDTNVTLSQSYDDLVEKVTNLENKLLLYDQKISNLEVEVEELKNNTNVTV